MKNLYQITLLFIFLFSANALLFAQTGAGGENGFEAYNQWQDQGAADILENDIK